MSSDSSLTPREEQEARLTALLLGELTAEEAEQVRQALAQDAALAQLHERLKQTLGLVREAAASTEETATPQPAAPRLSPDKRQRLLQSFKVVRPDELFRRRQRSRMWREVAAMAAMLMCLLALGGLVWQSGAGWELKRQMTIASLKAVIEQYRSWTEAQAEPLAAIGGDRASIEHRENAVNEYAAPTAGKPKPTVESLRRAPQKPASSTLYLPDQSKRELLEEAPRGQALAAKDGKAQSDWFFNESGGAAQALPASGIGYGGAGGGGGAGGIQAGQPVSASGPQTSHGASPRLGDVPSLGIQLSDARKPQTTTPLPTPAVTTAFEWDTAGVAVKESGLTAPPPPQEPASRPTATVSKGLETRERFDALDVESQVVAGKDSDSDETRGNRTSGRQMEGAVLAGELAPLPIEFPAASRKNEPRAAVAKTPAPERPAPTAGSGPAAAPAPSQPSSTLAGRSIQDLNGIELEPLPIKFPAPTLKGTPSELPSGPNIEPLTDTPAGTRIVGLPDDEAKSAARPPATPAPGRFTPAYITDQATREESKLLDLSQVEAFTKHLFAPKKESSFQILVAQAGREAPGSVSETDALRNEPTIVGGARNTMATETAKASQRAGVKGSTLFDFSVDGALKYQWGLNGRTVNDGTVTFFNGVEGKKADMWMDLDDAAGNFQLGLTAADRSGPALNLELADRSFFARAGDQPAIVGEKVLSESLAKQRGEAGTTLRAKLKVADAEGEELAQRIAESEEARRTGVTATKGAGVVRKLAEIKDAIASTVAGTKANEAKAEKAEGEKRLSLERERVVGAQAKPAETAARGNVYSINAVGYLTTNALVSYDGAGTGAAASRPASEVTAGKRVDIALPAGGAEVGQTETFGRSYRARGLEPVKLQDGELKVASAPLPTPSQPAKSDSDMRPLQRSTNAPIPQPEVLTRDNAFSTFSLNVSDVSFKLAAASLEKGAMPDVATVRSEEFINAFDYRDPEPTAGAPIAFAWERARYPFAHNRDLLRFSVKTAASGRQPGRPLNLVLLLDNSGSMERADRVRIIQECLLVLAGQLQSQDCVSVVTFARTPRLWADGVPGNQAASALERVGTLTPEGGTNLEDALNLAYQTARRHFIAQGVNRVVLLTDGAANLGNVAPDALKQKVESFRQQGLALDCFGIGWEGFNDDLLELLSRNGDGRYGFVNTPEEAATEFAGQLAGALKVAASDVKVQVEFNPRRVTAYRQIGYAKHQLKKEQFRDNTVDAAEIGAAEAGNALYVVEVDPRGEGPLAIVRVRYKVPGTADYREHEWPVPFTGVAVPLEQASPALRLAATASAFSEWLVASPYAGDVAPDRLLSYLRGVPEVFGADPRPKKLEWMIRQAKSIAGK